MLIELGKTPAPRELRWFAGIWFPALCGVLAWVLRETSPLLAAGSVITGVTLSAAGLARPRIIRPVYVGLMQLTFPIGWVLSHVMLLVMYFGVITPVGLLVRLLRDPLDRAFDRQASTYWTPREPSSAARYFRQF